MSAAFASLLLACAPPPAQQVTELPFERLGWALLEATPGLSVKSPAPDADQEVEFRKHLVPLHAALDLGAFELWLPLRAVDSEGRVQDAPRPREWKTIADTLLALERRWCAVLGELEGAPGEETASALDALAGWVRRSGTKSLPVVDASIHAQARAVRVALLGTSDAAPLVVVIAPQRAQFLALIGAVGILAPGQKRWLWNESPRRSLGQALGPSAVALALSYGPPHAGDPPFLGQPIDQPTLRQSVVHSSSHLLCNRLASSAPTWMHEGVALVDAHGLCGADETLCSGYAGRPATVFDGMLEVPQAFLIFARIESSPFRSGASASLFREALRAAHEPEGFRVLDLDRGVAGLIAAGPFLGSSAIVPEEVRVGPKGLKEGFAEFFRAYCGAFVGWLAQPRGAGPTWLESTLRELRTRALASSKPPSQVLYTVLRDLTGLELGLSLDAESDLEARFQAWVLARR
jgi:hypothetical protein